MGRKIAVLLLLLIFVISAVGCNKQADKNSEYIAKVNGLVIPQAEFDLRVSQAAAMNNFDLEDPQFAAYKDIFELQILERMIDELLLENEARNVRKLEVKQEDIEAELTSIKDQFNSEEEFKSYFNDQLKMSEKDISKAIETQLLVQSLYEEVTKDITTSNTDAKEYYDQNKEEFYQEEQIRARHILVNTEEEARELIRLITEEGQDMAQLAALKSIEPAAKTSMGDLGYFGKGAMVKPFEDAAFALGVGEITKEPVNTTFGYHVIRVEDKIEAKQQTFEEVKGELEERFIFEEKSNEFTKFMDELKTKAEIENKLQEKIEAQNNNDQEAPEENSEAK